MRNRMTLLATLLLLLSSGVQAGLQEAANAYNSGDFKLAFRELEPLAAKGDAAAQYNLGLLYEFGQGVQVNYLTAAMWYRKAAEQGFALAQISLGMMYEVGRGVQLDETEAVEWYRKAAEQGNANAQYNLAVKYSQGRGVAQDLKAGIEWYRKAAEQGNAKAQGNLGLMYAQGRGVAIDKAQAYMWLTLAAETRDENILENKKEIEKEMTLEQIGQALALVKVWRQSHK